MGLDRAGTALELFDPPIEYVAEEEGIVLQRDGQKLVGICPLHPDSDPSFAVWRYNDRDFCGCWACGFGPTDAIGLIRAIRGCDYASALVIMRRYSRSLPEDWKPTKLQSSSVRDASRDFRAETDKSLQGDSSAAIAFLESRGLGEHEEWLRAEFGFGGDAKYVVVPHYTPSKKHVTGLKYRELGGKLLTMEGGTLAFLYGAWRDGDERTHVVLAEGESDCWRLAAYFRADARVIVLGLPHGACAPKPHWLAAIGDRPLLIFFDGDDTGREHAREWLRASPSGRMVMTPDGQDACTLSDEEIGILIQSATTNEEESA